MHWQAEAWKCAEPRENPKLNTDPAHLKVQNKTKHQCGQVFYRREQFQVHLDEMHKVKNSEYTRQQCKLRRVGRNGQKGFWCGFCQTVVSLKKRGLEAWDERFTHIDDEHFKKGEKVEAWYPMDKELPKGILDEEKQDSNSDGREGDASGSDADVETASDEGPRAGDIMTDLQPKHTRKVSVQIKKIVVREWQCCKCRRGGFSYDAHVVCFMEGCDHQRCDSCKISQRIEQPDPANSR